MSQYKEENKVFRVLSSIGIICVVMGHIGCKLFGIESWLPYYSFHMPLFAFISGYFYNAKYDKVPLKLVIKKTKRILIPFYLCALGYLLLQTILHRTTDIKIGMDFSFYNWLVVPWVKTQPVGFYIATWYMIALFLTESVYCLMRWMLSRIRNSKKRDITLFCLWGLVAVLIVIKNKCIPMQWQRVVLRSLFLAFFFHTGFCYKNYLNGREQKYIKWIIPVCIAVRASLMATCGSCEFDVWNCDFNHEWWIVLFMSFAGIMFWLSVSYKISPIVSNDGITMLIGRHTREIMTHHLFFYFIIKGIVGCLHVLVGTGVAFDFEKYKVEIYYHYVPWGGGGTAYLCVTGNCACY